MKFHLCKLPVATVRVSSGKYASIFVAQPGLASRFPTKLCLGTVQCQGSICYVKIPWKTQGFFSMQTSGVKFKGKPNHPHEDRQSFFFVSFCDPSFVARWFFVT